MQTEQSSSSEIKATTHNNIKRYKVTEATELVTVKTRELRGPAFNWAVARAIWARDIKIHTDLKISAEFAGTLHCACFRPMDNWDLCGEILQKFRLTIEPHDSQPAGLWRASMTRSEPVIVGVSATPCMAICKVLLAHYFGDTADVPAVLMRTTARG
ncbi:phage protein NinX family protein [Halopseudomonas oceani]|uniref:phage protein NinX family protein n=1 Tax=Halopseudomonas oceani TaxID=1708783 RepID=UPI002AA604B4|nr:phage protein NinX family protein [Halopseudomonas oceani]